MFVWVVPIMSNPVVELSLMVLVSVMLNVCVGCTHHVKPSSRVIINGFGICYVKCFLIFSLK